MLACMTINITPPHCHREIRTKDNITWEDDDKVVCYRQWINYSYDEALSGGLDPMKTKITTINVPLIVSPPHP